MMPSIVRSEAAAPSATVKVRVALGTVMVPPCFGVRLSVVVPVPVIVAAVAAALVVRSPSR